MRAPTLAFIFILAEYSIITGGDGNCGDPPEVKYALKVQNLTDLRFRMPCTDGYLRKAGTSNLFKCNNNEWVNTPKLVCIRNPSLPDVTTQSHTSAPPVNQTSSSSTPTTLCLTTKAEKSTSTTTRGSTVASFFGGKTGITAGTIILVIIVALAATVAILIWRRRSKPSESSGPSIIMITKHPDTQEPLMNPITITSNCPQDSIQPPVVPFRDSIEACTNCEPST
ncbi:interleukin-15 receptor subunit alpha isoform X4 [Clarias gariepinus]|uniref:interleukin-15 receptor subunit alpha isoform X4 n=1 Tax=Clarias gariepinus TaxID=13013 RepID=UPI00234DD958|nr:interleukin-15 receptor subunit alpha isoform X4 [Clarias gariepinus]